MIQMDKPKDRNFLTIIFALIIALVLYIQNTHDIVDIIVYTILFTVIYGFQLELVNLIRNKNEKK